MTEVLQKATSPPSILELSRKLEMSSGSSMAAPQKFIFKEPTKQLRRGKACLNCRFHKIKCDGVKPVCGSCTRLPRDEECEYAGGPSKMKELEQRLTRLKARVRELESPEMTGSGLQLAEPYMTTDSGGGLSPMPGSGTNSSSDHSNSSPSLRPSFDPLLGSPEPSISIITMLLNNFLPFATKFGFFLHLERFKSAALLNAPFGDISRPSPALLNATYLWGAHLSSVDALRTNETIFINRSLQQVSVEIPNAIHSAQIMHTIQAEILLSTYFFRKNQLLEAEFHLNGAVSLAQSAGLHQIRSDRVFSSPVVSVLLETEMFLPPARDVIEEGERINGFWAVYCLHRLISITLGNASKCFGGLDTPCREIDAPWPREYEFGLYNGGAFGRSTIDCFIHDLTPASGLVFDLSSYAKAVVILHSATALTHQFSRGIETEDAYAAFMDECLMIDNLITRFHCSLPSSDVDDESFLTQSIKLPSHSNTKSSLVLTHVLVSCAYMQIQKIFSSCGIPDALDRCIGTAQSIISTLGDVNRLGLPHLNPIVGTLCAMACSVFGDAFARAEMLGDWTFDSGMIPTSPSTRIDPVVLRQGLQLGMTTMSILAMDSPLMKYQLNKLQNSYSFML
ncbi:hypothetical protein GGU10DRAFT_20372 [Lentinula aff. detonsa]|uniref:Zn(2)-C6 fungal-type domain-containing protein n=1 Tax=Lentinula aff. detonsa TaxID=2804958 RepID=A0AA38KVU1_9AGAR|nr:hypothetical protein GGU10DRAFT_20372 [Lentinula aff. detonsa]